MPWEPAPGPLSVLLPAGHTSPQGLRPAWLQGSLGLDQRQPLDMCPHGCSTEASDLPPQQPIHWEEVVFSAPLCPPTPLHSHLLLFRCHARLCLGLCLVLLFQEDFFDHHPLQARLFPWLPHRSLLQGMVFRRGGGHTLGSDTASLLSGSSKIRIRDGRAKPIDLLAKYISAEDDDLAVEMHEPYTFLNGLTVADMEDLLEDIQVPPGPTARVRAPGTALRRTHPSALPSSRCTWSWNRERMQTSGGT